MPRLIVKFPSGSRAVPLGDEAVTIGRTNDNTIPIDAEGASRKHVQILFVGKGWELVDMGSRNGTRVNGQKVTRAMLKAGDVVQVAGIDMVFEEDGAAAAGSGLDVEELDIGGAQASAPSPSSASRTMAMAAGGGPAGECVLRFVDGERKGEELPLKGPRTTFGRRASNTVAFQDAAVSGVHCEITREANGYVLRDLGSTNGTLVDGEPVVETMLRHSSRIRIGAQRMLFTDPTVADIESSLAGADDAAEWGLMRGEIDVSAVRGRGGRSALVAVVVVAAAAGAGWWAIQGRARPPEIAEVRDNRIPDFSFEDGVVRWFSPEEGGATARVDGTPEKPQAASGQRCLEVLPQGEGLARVEFTGASEGGADASVAPDAAYEISAKVGSGTGAVVVVWISSTRPGLVREVSSPAVDGKGSWPSTSAVVIAPAQATAARIQLVAFGGRPATFDDVVFRRAEGTQLPPLLSADLQVRLDAGGFLEAVRGGEVLLTQAGVAPTVETKVEDLLGAAPAAPPAHTGSALTLSGTTRGGGAFDLKAELAAGGAVFSAVPKGGPGAFTFTCPAGMARGAVTLVLARTALVLPEDEAFKQEGVRKVIVGTADGPDPFVFAADPASPGFSFASLRTPRGLRIQLSPPASPPQGVDAAAVHLSVDQSREKGDAETLLRSAREAETVGKLGQAAEAYRRLAIEYFYLPGSRREGEESAARLEKEGGDRMKAATESLDSGKQFKSAPDLEKAVGLLTDLKEKFGGSALGTRAEQLLADAEASVKQVRAESVRDRVDRHAARARDYLATGQAALAVPLLEEILRIAPEDSPFKKWAGDQLPTVRSKVEEERLALFGKR